MFHPATLLPFAARRSSLGLMVENCDGAAAGLAPAPPLPQCPVRPQLTEIPRNGQIEISAPLARSCARRPVTARQPVLFAAHDGEASTVERIELIPKPASMFAFSRPSCKRDARCLPLPAPRVNRTLGRGSDLAIFPGIWTHSFCRLLLNA